MKDINYYLNLDYDVTVRRLEADGDVVYNAFSRDLNSSVFYGTGDTKQEALQSFEETKNEMIEVYFEENRNIPEPTREDNTLPSGKFLLRISPRIHSKLIDLSKSTSQSLNSCVNGILIEYITGVDIISKFCGLNIQPNNYKMSELQIQPKVKAFEDTNYGLEEPSNDSEAA